MSDTSPFLIVNQITLSPDASFKEAFSVSGKRLAAAGIRVASPQFSVCRRSVDARKKDNIRLLYSVAVRGELPANLSAQRLAAHGISLEIPETPAPVYGTEPLSAPPVVVGSGPAGLFCALMLAESGYAPLLLERGGEISERRETVRRFYEEHVLDPDCNIQFGAGGAGTFSDGKLITRIHDGFSGYVLRRFVEFGAPEEILYLAKPHVGTDILSTVVGRMLSRIEELGGRVLYHTTYLSEVSRAGRVVSVKTSRGDFPAGALVLAIGHSARDTYETLLHGDYRIEPKSFSVGMRIEHLAADIDRAMYGGFAGHPNLGHAEYALSHNTKVRGVYTFCMCPGGEVVAAASEEGMLAVNGMSYHARDNRNSDSAVVCSVFREDYGNTPAAAIAFQREIERKAFLAGGGGFSAPVVTVGDFLAGRAVTEPSRILPTYMNGENVRVASPDLYLPAFVAEGLRGGLVAFDRKIRGFAASDAVLTGAETRTSAPLRILRDPVTRLAPGFENLYPTGEGAGYAGGITSAAIDGVRTALALMARRAPKISG